MASPKTLHDPEEDYRSSEDSDFAPEAAAEDNTSSVSDNEEDATERQKQSAAATKKRNRYNKAGTCGTEAEDAGFENSGDEAIIEKGRKKKRRRKGVGKGKEADEGGEEDGDTEREGSFVKTRSACATVKAERRAAAATGPVTIDVDTVWAQMISESIAPTTTAASKQEDPVASRDAPGSTAHSDAQASKTSPKASPAPQGDSSDSIKICRTYKFAGKIHTEEKIVPRHSAEAKLYLASQSKGAKHEAPGDSQRPRRLPRKAFRSAFEPPPVEPSGLRRADLDLAVAVRLQAREKAKKLNTVEKSRMDWAGFVDKEGIQDELAMAGKSKESYAARQEFLARSEMVRQEDARRIRIAGVGKVM